MSSHVSEEDINLVNNFGRQANNSNCLHGIKDSAKQTRFNEQENEECHNLINSDNSGSECNSPKQRVRIDKPAGDISDRRSSFNSECGCPTSLEIQRQSSQDTNVSSSNGDILEDVSSRQQCLLPSDKEMSDNGNGVLSDGDSSSMNHSQATMQLSNISNNCTNNKIENNECCGSPLSDITDPELAQVNVGEWASRDGTKVPYSESPSSDLECNSSCAEDSGISSTVRDDEMEEIPLADGTLSPELFQEMSRLNVNDMVSSWVPKSSNTYSPNINKSTTSATTETQESQNRRK